MSVLVIPFQNLTSWFLSILTQLNVHFEVVPEPYSTGSTAAVHYKDLRMVTFLCQSPFLTISPIPHMTVYLHFEINFEINLGEVQEVSQVIK